MARSKVSATTKGAMTNATAMMGGKIGKNGQRLAGGKVATSAHQAAYKAGAKAAAKAGKGGMAAHRAGMKSAGLS